MIAFKALVRSFSSKTNATIWICVRSSGSSIWIRDRVRSSGSIFLIEDERSVDFEPIWNFVHSVFFFGRVGSVSII
ncbi:hypothetical protein U1Q18_035700 [Sarracenia purpurea var. burkii]